MGDAVSCVVHPRRSMHPRVLRQQHLKLWTRRHGELLQEFTDTSTKNTGWSVVWIIADKVRDVERKMHRSTCGIWWRVGAWRSWTMVPLAQFSLSPHPNKARLLTAAQDRDRVGTWEGGGGGSPGNPSCLLQCTTVSLTGCELEGGYWLDCDLMIA